MTDTTLWTFRAMGTDVHLAAPTLAPDAQSLLAERVADVFEANEQRFSRFREDSELSLLNRTRGPCVVSPELFDLLWAAQRHVEATDGVFDPAIGAPLIALGYDAPFAPGALDRRALPEPPRRASLREVALDPATRTVDRPPHVVVDLGGIAKGRTVDQAARLLPAIGALDAGGDAALRGAGPDREGWLVDVESPRDAAHTLLTLRVRDRAVATSAPNRRHWRAGGEHVHHLVDPRTGRSARSDLAQVTIVADTTERADVLAKTTFLLGRSAGRAALERMPHVGAVLVRGDGCVERVGDVDVADGRGGVHE